MTQIHADEVTVSGAVALQQILALKLVARVNQHATLQVRGYLDAAEYNKVVVKPMNGQILTVTCSGELYFTGLILDIELSMENALHIANIQCISESYQFDTLKKSHSYQNKDMMYSAMLKQVSEGTGPILFLAKDKVIQKPIVQYQETDWEFTKRMASRFGTVVIPEIRYELPQISLGIVNGENYDVPETTEYIDGVRTSFYNKKKHLNPCRIGDFAYCRVKDRRIFQLGDKIAFHNQNWVVMEKEMWLERGLLNNLYTLGHEMGFGLAYYANEKISGMSIMGNVIKTDAENVKLKLDIDKNHDSGEYWYRYTPQSGNLFYLMPKVGTRLALFFPDDEEENSTAMSSPRTNGRYMEDPSVRELLTEHYKRMTLAPKWLEFQGGTNLVQLADEKGISFNSQRPIEITANKVFFTASNQAIINANQEFVARKSKSENAIRIFGSEMHIYAPIRYLSGESKSFPPVKQIAQEEPNDGGLLGLVLGAVAVVAVGVIAGPEIALGCLLLGGCAFLLTGCPSRTVSSPDDSSSEDSDSSSSSGSSSAEVTSGDEPSSGPDEEEASSEEEIISQETKTPDDFSAQEISGVDGLVWYFTDDSFLNKDSLTKDDILDILKTYSQNPNLQTEEFAQKFYDTLQNYSHMDITKGPLMDQWHLEAIKKMIEDNGWQDRTGINPKIILATLQWEAGWNTKNGGHDPFSLRFGKPRPDGDDFFADMEGCMNAYLRAFYLKKWIDENLEFVQKNEPSLLERPIGASRIVPDSASLYSRLTYTPDGVRETMVWQDSIINGVYG